MKKIVFITNRLAEGGAEKVVATLANELIKEHDVHIILIENKIKYYIDPNVKLHILNEKIQKENKVKLIFSLINMRRRLKNIIEELNKHNRIDLLTSHLVISDFLCKISNLKPFYCVHNIYTEHPTFKSKIFQLFFKWLYNKEKLIAISQGVKLDIQQNMNLKPTQIHIIPNPVKFENRKNDHTNLPEKKYFLHIGRFEEQKRHDILLKAYKEAQSEYPLYLLGEGKNKEKIVELTQKLNIVDNVIFKGWVDNPKEWIENCECLILSSDSEGLPIVVLEAFSLGKPVITTNFLGSSDIIGVENIGFLAQKGNYNDLADKLKNLNFSEFKVPSIEKYKVNNVVKLYLNLINNG